jgi:hypothetical protein
LLAPLARIAPEAAVFVALGETPGATKLAPPNVHFTNCSCRSAARDPKVKLLAPFELLAPLA